jgi:heterotetrameric sarcosine oxidase gamma subunit
VCASEVQSAGAADAGVRIAGCTADIIELAAYRGQAGTLAALAAERGVPLPAFGHVGHAARGLVLAVRPARWLLLAAPAEPGSVARSWQEACSGCAAVIELSAAVCLFHVTGEATREMLKRGCRLDLDPRGGFPSGTAASTIMAQVPVTLAALADGMLLLAPSSTARHFREWLITASRAFGLGLLSNASVALLSGEPIS